MEDWLKYYNMLDVGPLVLAIEKQFDKFYEYFKVDLTQHNSLPSIALRYNLKTIILIVIFYFSAMLALYDQKQPFVYLLMTNYAKLLLDRGINISNVTKMVQYQPGNALSPFVDTVKRMRIEATLEGDDLKATTVKLVGNSCKYFLI